MKPSENDNSIVIQDDRPFDFLWLDREIRRPSPNGKTWLALIQPTCASILICLCSHAGKHRESYPSYATIAEECGISRRAAIDGIAKLLSFGFVRRGKKTNLRTNTFILQGKDKWKAATTGRKERTDKRESGVIVNDLHYQKKDVIVNDLHSDSESFAPLIVNDLHSDSESFAPKVKSLKKSHLSKASEEREQKQNENAETQGKNLLALSSSPSGMVFLSFFRGECERLNTTQVKQIIGMTEPDLLRQAIEHLQGNGYQVATKISLLLKVMGEIRAAASVSSSPLPASKSQGAPVTVKSLERRANLSKLAEMRAAVADVIDVPVNNFSFLEA